MTQPDVVETLESAGDRWRGGVEWCDDWERWVRHWWKLHPRDPILIHRASGEQVAYIGQIGDKSWHRFEYRHRDIIYPLAVQMKSVQWPNPRAGKQEGPRPEDVAPEELTLHVWHIDHLRSSELWRRENDLKAVTDQPPPYSLWRRADQAIADAALLWPSVFRSEIKAANVVAIGGGWLNVTWRVDFFRRMRRRRDLTQYRPGASSGLSEIPGWPMPRSVKDLGLPLSDYRLESEAPAPGWKATEATVGYLNEDRGNEHWEMQNQRDGSTIRVGVYSAGQLEEPSRVVIVQRDNIAWILPISDRAIHPTVCLDGPCSIAGSPVTSERMQVPWLSKQVLLFDGIRSNSVPTYDPDVINHPLASYQSWRFLYDGLLNALLFFPGFAGSALGAHAVNIVGGFVGGSQGLVTEARLKLDLSSGKENETWSILFS